MDKWNEEAAPNNNLSSKTIGSSKFVSKNRKNEQEFSEELSDGGDRNDFIEKQRINNQAPNLYE